MGNSTYQFDYFSVRETEAFRYYQLPQIFFEDERFKKKSGCKFSTDAKVLYSMLLNRVSLSKKINGLINEVECMLFVQTKKFKICWIVLTRKQRKV